MKKNILLIISVIIILGLAVGGYFLLTKKTIKPVQKNISEELVNLDEKLVKKEIPKETQEDKIKKLKKRFSIRGVIIKGDYYLQNDQPLLALNRYKVALRENHNDEKINKKIADVYFELKNYKNSSKYYKKILNTQYQDNRKLILSWIYSADLSNTEKTRELMNEIKLLSITNEEKFYYINSLNCSIDFKKCKIAFNEYVDKKRATKMTELSKIEKAIIKYRNFASNELSYKNALIAGAYFENELYPIASIVSKKILAEKKDYSSILLILGKSNYEIGDYKNAIVYLSKYHELNPKDENVVYLLGIINFKLKNYIDSSLYLNIAIENGYTPKLDLQRRLVYNYYLLGDKKSMMKVFKEMLETSDSTEDFSLGIYNAIMQKDIKTAEEWTRKGLEKFKGEEIFYGYLGWIFREKNELEKAEEYLRKGLKINPRNPLITLNMGYLMASLGKKVKARLYFKRTIMTNNDGEFGELAEKNIKFLEESKNN